MPAPPITKDIAQATIGAINEALEKGHKPLGYTLGGGETGSITAAARALGSSHSTVMNRVRQAEKLYGIKPDWSLYVPLPRGALPGFEVRAVTTRTDKNGQFAGETITQGPERGKPFEVPVGHAINGVSALVGPDGRTVQQWVKTKAENSDHVIDALKETFAKYKGHAKPVPPPKHASRNLLTVYPIGDFHAGLYSWAAETGEDWDLDIAEKTLRGTMADLVSSAPASETGLVLSLGDFFHMDDASNRTPASGHALDVDTRRAKVLQVGVKLLIDCIELALAKHKKVIVRCLAGNHDPATTPALNIALWAFFNKNPRVSVDCSPSKFFYHQFGKVMIASTHGDMCKMADLPGVMASAQPEMWGASRFRYGYTGHIHHKSQICKEINGVICESFQVLPPADAWHASQGYGAGRSMQAITHHRETGEKFRHIVSIVPNR
jgi:hypothetical protein